MFKSYTFKTPHLFVYIFKHSYETKIIEPRLLPKKNVREKMVWALEHPMYFFKIILFCSKIEDLVKNLFSHIYMTINSYFGKRVPFAAIKARFQRKFSKRSLNMFLPRGLQFVMEPLHCTCFCFFFNHQEAKNNREEKRSFVPRKKKCALLLCYCGAGYNGMQM